MWSRLPVEQKDPAGQSSHSLLLPSPGVLLYVPFPHGSGADAPSAQNEPGTQTKQAVAPLAFWYEPLAHLSHVPCPVAFCRVPAKQSEGSDTPVAQEAPLGHAVQLSWLTKPGVALNLPNGQGSAADAPFAQKNAAGHSMHAVWPSSC